jgi:hypothetical protein
LGPLASFGLIYGMDKYVCTIAKNKFITMQQENMAQPLLNLFHLPLSVQAFDQLHDLVSMA